METITLPLWDQICLHWRVVEAELVDVAPHLSGSFAVHQCPWRDCSMDWKVSNVETGFVIAYGMTRSDALDAARRRLAGKTEAQYQQRLRVWARTPAPKCCEFHY